MPDETVIAVLDCLIPGDATGWPAAGQHGLAPRLHELLELLAADGPEQSCHIYQRIFSTVERPADH